MYKYEDFKNIVFLEENQKTFLEIRDQVHKLLSTARYIDMSQAIEGIGGSNWDNMAYVDRLLELGEIHEIEVVGNNRIFTK